MLVAAAEVQPMVLEVGDTGKKNEHISGSTIYRRVGPSTF